MKKTYLHTSTVSLLVLLAIVTITAVLSYFSIAKPVEVDNFVGPQGQNPFPDGLDWLRRLLIYPGLIFSLAALGIFIKSAVGKRSGMPDKILNYFLLLLIFCLGWVCMPYWANGLHHAFASDTTSLYDPKSLLPYTDISVVWSIFVMAFHLFAYILVLLPVILAFIDIRKNGFNIKYIFAVSVYLFIFASFFFAPYYLYWFLD
ncbi:MAG: hypothetical protein ABI543_02215 [Ignavibacteria bacterium]